MKSRITTYHPPSKIFIKLVLILILDIIDIFKLLLLIPLILHCHIHTSHPSHPARPSSHPTNHSQCAVAAFQVEINVNISSLPCPCLQNLVSRLTSTSCPNLGGGANDKTFLRIQACVRHNRYSQSSGSPHHKAICLSFST